MPPCEVYISHVVFKCLKKPEYFDFVPLYTSDRTKCKIPIANISKLSVSQQQIKCNPKVNSCFNNGRK